MNRTGITIIQHPRERRHPLGTARFAALGLQGVRLLVDIEGRFRGEVAPVGFPERTGILYPSPHATPLPAAGAADAPEHLLVIDGTWHQAKTLYRDMAWLRTYPHYVLNPEAPSRYRIRREPELSYISTLEALLLAITQLEPELAGVDRLLHAFDAMIDQQIDCEEHSQEHRERHPRRDSEHRRKPRALAEQFPNLVIVYAETMPAVKTPERPDVLAGSQKPTRQLSYFCAHRLRDDTTFERWVVTPGTTVPAAILDATSAHGRARDHEFVSPARFQCDLATFVTPRDSFAAWGPNSLRWLPPEFKQPPGRTVLLKAACGAISPGQGSMEQIIERGGLKSKACPIPGRGGRRLSHARAIAEWIHGRS